MAAVTMSSGVLPFIGWHAQTLAAEPQAHISRAELLRLQRSVADIKAQLANRRNKYFQDAQAEMTKAQEDLSSQTEQLKDRSQVLEHT